MPVKPTYRQSKSIPSSRLSRASRLGALAGKIAGSVMAQGAEQLLKGEKPALSSLLLTPRNMHNIADQLARMRGAAMKLGQLISMDAGDFLPAELADILARLREDADPMPTAQLIDTLNKAWGPNWQSDLRYFSFHPIAAASVGQVHKITTQQGKTLAVKVQYPGVRKSIDSDVDNVATLIKLSGLLPKSLDIKPLLEEAKTQLHQEADYHREAAMLTRYKQHLSAMEHFIIPATFAPLTTENVLAMDFIEAEDLDVLLKEPQSIRNRVMRELFTLFLNEVFTFKLLQSDPNLANYKYQTITQKLVLLDFGATREVPDAIAEQYRQLLISAVNFDHQAMKQAALKIGLINTDHSPFQVEAVITLGMEACESLRHQGDYDFGQSDLVQRLNDKGLELTLEQDFWHTPPVDALFIHRKLGGLFLLAKRLRAQVDMQKIAEPWLKP